MHLNDFGFNIYSQNGEDGVILEILRRIGSVSLGHCVEFGAWDGRHLSNTFNLVENYGWSATYIEADPVRFLELKKLADKFSRIKAINARVSCGPDDGYLALEDLLEANNCPAEVDILSIDIDSFDLEVWARLRLRPKICILEINSSVVPGIVSWYSSQQESSGNSFSAALTVAQKAGYALVCHIGNLIFVRDDLVDLIGLDSLDLKYPERLFHWDWVAVKPSMRERLLLLLTKLPPRLKNFLRSVLRIR